MNNTISNHLKLVILNCNKQESAKSIGIVLLQAKQAFLEISNERGRSNIRIQLEVQKFLNFKQDNVCMINASVIVSLHIRPQMEWITNAFIIEGSSK